MLASRQDSLTIICLHFAALSYLPKILCLSVYLKIEINDEVAYQPWSAALWCQCLGPFSFILTEFPRWFGHSGRRRERCGRWTGRWTYSSLLDKQQQQSKQKIAVNMSVYVADILSSLSFLIGSILFYPCFDTPKGVMMLVAAWLFVVGSVLMLLVMVQDMKIIVSALRKLEVVDDISSLPIQQMQRQRSTAFQLLNNGTVSIWEIRNAVLYITSGILFVIGSAFFHPYLYYSKCASSGVSLFIAGIILQLVAVVWDTARFLVQGERKSSQDVWILFLPAIGLLLFLIGCLHFYPRFQRDDFDAYYAASYFVVGSVIFLISSLMKVVVLNKEYGAQEGRRQSQTLLLRRRAISIRCNSIIL